MKSTYLVVGVAMAFAAAALSAGCSEGDPSCAAAVKEALPSMTCPSKAPTYKADVEPLIAKYCIKCHQAGGEESDIPYTSYASVKAEADDMQDELSQCDMPPSGNPQPTADEHITILQWLDCGAKDD